MGLSGAQKIKVRFWSNATAAITIISQGILLTGCATGVKPEEIALPTQITCINLPKPISFSAKYGAMDWVFEVRLERGPYISEREDSEGIYYRAPPGGVFDGREGFMNHSTGVATLGTLDVGIFVPHDPQVDPRLYYYQTVAPIPQQIPPEDMDCSSFVQVKDPLTSKINILNSAATGAVGGALGRAAISGTSWNKVSYGQAAAGGAAAGVVISLILNNEIGRIYPGRKIKDGQFSAKLKELAAQVVPVREASFHFISEKDTASSSTAK